MTMSPGSRPRPILPSTGHNRPMTRIATPSVMRKREISIANASTRTSCPRLANRASRRAATLDPGLEQPNLLKVPRPALIRRRHHVGALRLEPVEDFPRVLAHVFMAGEVAQPGHVV